MALSPEETPQSCAFWGTAKVESTVIKITQKLFYILFILLNLLMLPVTQAEQNKRPNLLLIVVDDMGFQ